MSTVLGRTCGWQRWAIGWWRWPAAPPMASCSTGARPSGVASARRTIAEGAEAAGRDPASVTVAVYVRAALGVDDDAALPSLQAMTGLYASYPAYRAQMAAMGFAAESEAAAAAHAAGRPGDVPESLVRALIVLGGRGEAARAFRAYREAGADLVLCYPVGRGTDPLSSVMGTAHGRRADDRDRSYGPEPARRPRQGGCRPGGRSTLPIYTVGTVEIGTIGERRRAR